MKSNFLREVLDEEILELDIDCQEAIRRFRAQSEESYEADKRGVNLFFQCSPKGKLYVGYSSFNYRQNLYIKSRCLERSKIYYVRGEVLPANHKTFVKIYSVYSRLDIFWMIFLTAVFIIFAACYIWFGDVLNDFLIIKACLIAVILGGVPIGAVAYTVKRVLSNKNEILELMKNEIKRRVENVKRWDL